MGDVHDTGGRNGGRLRPFVLGPFTVRPEFNEVVVNGHAERLEPQIIAVLCHLHARLGEVVSRDELIDACWGGLAVTDDAVTRCISRLRQLFRGAEDAVTIETISKRGYCLRVADQSGKLPLAASPAPASVRSKPSHIWLWTFVVLLIVTAAGYFFWVSQNRATPPITYNPSRPLTAEAGLESQPALSPDGSYVAYVGGRSDGPSDLFLRAVDRSDPAVQLTATPAVEEAPAWSPDGTRLAFARLDGRTCHILVQTVPATAETTISGCTGRSRVGLAWLSDREIILSDLNPDTDAVGMFRLDLRNGRRIALTQGNREGSGDRFPIGLDRGRIAYARSISWFDNEIRLLDSSGKSRRVAQQFGEVWGLARGPNERLVVSGTRDGRSGLWLIDGQKISYLEQDVRSPGMISGTASGAVAVESWARRTNLFDVYLDGRRETPIAPSSSIDLSGYRSPDGRTIAFISRRSGRAELWIERNGVPSQLTNLRADDLYLAGWDPEGRRLLFAVRIGKTVDLRLLEVKTGVSRILLVDPASGLVPRWSADGRAAYFCSLRDGRPRIWRFDFSTGAVTPVSPPGYFVSSPSPDGRWLYLSDGRTPVIRRMPLAGTGTVQTILAGIPGVSPVSFVATDEGLYYLDLVAENRAVLRYHKVGGTGGDKAVVTLAGLPRQRFAISISHGHAIVPREVYSDMDLALITPR